MGGFGRPFLWANQMALFNFWKSKEWRADNVKPAEDITQTTALEYGMSSAPHFFAAGRRQPTASG